MKNVIFSIFVLAVVAFASSCMKPQTTTADPGKASVTLHLGINYDETNDTSYAGNFETVYENVPSGTVIQFIMDSRDLQENPVNNYDYDMLTYTGTVDANGDVIVELPAIADPASVEVKFPDLELTNRYDGTSALTGEDTVFTELVIYTKNNQFLSVWDGAVLIQDHFYNLSLIHI